MAVAKKILVTGAHGQLGSELRDLAPSFPGFEFLFTDADTLDITDEGKVNDYFKEHQPAVCVNCAAYTAVDKAETEREIAEKINATAVGYLARSSAANNAAFIHISTDYVFSGVSDHPYVPDDKTNPVNFYGLTKLHGEEEAMKNQPAAIIIRTAWVYSSYGNNFVKTMMRLMKDRPEISVVADQRGTPTYAADLAAVIMKIADENNFVPGIYHYTNEGEISWYDFAVEIARMTRSECKVNPISTSQYPTPAARPSYSVLDKSKIRSTFGLTIPEWQDSLIKCITLIKERS